MPALAWMATLTLLLATTPAFATGNALVGRYGHDSTEPADEPVWQVERVADGYTVEYLAVGEREPAWLLDSDGRAAFWERMMWPTDTARNAECLSWGEAPLMLADLLDMPDDASAPAVKAASAQTPGAGVLCRVEPAARAKISWLSDNLSDYFFHDAMGGVMEVRQLPDQPAAP